MLKVIYCRLMRMYYESALTNVGYAHPDSAQLIVAIQHHARLENLQGIALD